MKQKTHSGLKKRVKVRKSGSAVFRKSSKNHMLTNKSKRQKKSFPNGMPIDSSHIERVKKSLPHAKIVSGT